LLVASRCPCFAERPQSVVSRLIIPQAIIVWCLRPLVPPEASRLGLFSICPIPATTVRSLASQAMASRTTAGPTAPLDSMGDQRTTTGGRLVRRWDPLGALYAMLVKHRRQAPANA
jgi:hypothetical protein